MATSNADFQKTSQGLSPRAAVDLRSDTLSRPTASMRRAMAEAEVGDDLWREDPTTCRLEEDVAARFGHEAALFVPSGTMGNQICLHLATPPGTECLVAEDNHVVWYESAAASRLFGVQLHMVPSTQGIVPAAVFAARLRTAAFGVPTAAIAVEQTHNRGGGSVWPLSVLQDVRSLADSAGLRVHCDGARIWHAHIATGIPLEVYGGLFDSLSVCFSKGLAAPVGSAIVGSRAFIEEARSIRRLLGGGMRQSGVLAAAALVGMQQMMERLADDHAHAQRFACALAERQPGATDPASVETNIVHLDSAAFGLDAPALVERFALRGLLAAAVAPDRVRCVFHHAIDDAATDAAIAAAAP